VEEIETMGSGLQIYMALAVIGVLTGSLIGTLGIGAGALMIPSLMLFAGFRVQEAVGMTLAMQTIPVGVYGAYLYWQKGWLKMRQVAWVAAAMFAGIGLGAFAVTRYPDVFTERALTLALGAVLIALGTYMFYTACCT
jgi:uncharacterized protein